MFNSIWFRIKNAKIIDQSKKFSRFNRIAKNNFKQTQLRHIIDYAMKNSSFYASLYSNLDFSKSIHIEDLPIIDKSILINQFDQLISQNNITRKTLDSYFKETFSFINRYSKQYYAFHTSGSTGNPAYVLWNENEFNISIINYYERIIQTLKIKSNAISETKVLYIGILDDYIGGNSWVYGMKNFANIRMLSIFSPIDKLMKDIFDFKPHIIMTKPSLLGELARKMHENKMTLSISHAIFAGEMISPNDKEDIEKYFNTHIYNSYSMCETGPIAIQSVHSEEGLEILENLVWLELVDDNNRPINSLYETGTIVITNLYNKTMPMIRYKTGDKAYYVPGKEKDHLNMISYIQGRSTSFFLCKDRDNNLIKVSEFPFWSLYIPGINRYQIIQIDHSILKVLIEWNKYLTDDEKRNKMIIFDAKINRIIKSYDTIQNIQIIYEEVEKIQANAAGKIQITIPLKIEMNKRSES